MTYINRGVIFAAVIGLTVCKSMDIAGANGKKPTEPITGAQSFNLTDVEQQALQQKANEGDAGAALRLARFYAFAKNDAAQEMIWLTRAAELGDASAQYNLAYAFIYDENYKDLDAAGQWLEKAMVGVRGKRDEKLEQSILSLQAELARERK